MDINTLSGFISTYRLPVLMSLTGALIGHFSHYDSIQFPMILILYKKGNFLENCAWYWMPIRIIYLCLDFLIFILGLRFKETDANIGIYIEMGFLGDLLVGIGTGILAKTALALSDVNNDFAVVSSSLLAGFVGLSYITSKLEKKEKEEQESQYSMKDISNSNDIEIIEKID